MKIAVKILDIDEKNEEITLIEMREGHEILWLNSEKEYAGPDFQMKFVLDKNSIVPKEICLGKNIMETEDDLKHKFSELLFEERTEESINQNDGFDSADEEEEEKEKINPYNPKLIRVDTKPFSIFQISQMIENEDIDLSPDFQRGFVWNDITRKSRLIESLLLRIPLPVFYFAQDEEGLFQVVDGVQRLTVIQSFMKNEFKLKNLEYLHECEGKWFRNPNVEKDMSLSGIYTRRIEQTQLFINVIDPQTPYRVKYDIFKRINTGGKTLNNQEIRNCLAYARTREFLHALSKSEEFLRATRKSISPVRMADEELILRFIAFYLIDTGISETKEYRGGMDELLDETVSFLNGAEISLFKEIRMAFLNAMNHAYFIFGDRAFRKANYINKALFLGLTRCLWKYSGEEIEKKNIYKIKQELERAIQENIGFTNALSMATNDARNVIKVYETIHDIIQEA